MGGTEKDRVGEETSAGAAVGPDVDQIDWGVSIWEPAAGREQALTARTRVKIQSRRNNMAGLYQICYNHA